jgi:hypothetical protein
MLHVEGLGVYISLYTLPTVGIVAYGLWEVIFPFIYNLLKPRFGFFGGLLDSIGS